LRPFARRLFKTKRPFLLAILARKPCVFARRRLLGWNVLFDIDHYSPLKRNDKTKRPTRLCQETRGRSVRRSAFYQPFYHLVLVELRQWNFSKTLRPGPALPDHWFAESWLVSRLRPKFISIPAEPTQESPCKKVSDNRTRPTPAGSCKKQSNPTNRSRCFIPW
jgi:hypothetical protein